jgi:hypothetical protein
LYCLSYCPLAPGLHNVIFDVIDEITEVFEADAFHAGMDEVFYIGMDERCKGRDPSELFAGEVRAIRDHLALSHKELWIWGDRYMGIMETVWSSAENAIGQFYGRQDSRHPRGGDWVKTFKALFDEMGNTDQTL